MKLNFYSTSISNAGVHKINRWDVCTSAKVVIDTNNGSGSNKTEFNFKSPNVGLDRRIDKTKTLDSSLILDKEDRQCC